MQVTKPIALGKLSTELQAANLPAPGLTLVGDQLYIADEHGSLIDPPATFQPVIDAHDASTDPDAQALAAIVQVRTRLKAVGWDGLTPAQRTNFALFVLRRLVAG